MDYDIEIRSWGRVFTVPCSVADDYLKNTDGNYLKVLLCVLSWGNAKFSDDKIAELTGLDKDVVNDALLYWNDKEVISISGIKSFTGFEPEVKAVPTVKKAAAEAVHIPESEKAKAESVSYSPAKMAAMISKNKELKNFFDTVQSILGRTLNNTELRGFIYIYECYGFEASAMLLIAEHCVNLGKGSIYYIKSVAKSFYEQDIVSYSEIERHIIALEEQHSYENLIASAFGITTKLTPTQKKYIQSWQNMGISVELSEYAYELCADNTGKLQFKYIDTIIQRWNTSGIRTVEQAKNERFAYSVSKKDNGKSSSSYDLNEIDEFQKNFLLGRSGAKQ